MNLQQQPCVSVLIPAYNEEKYIGAALTALLQQHYRNFEILVVDNASQDGTAAVVTKFINDHKHCGIDIRLLHEHSQGTQFARECGRRAATGAIIAQMDADCQPAPDWLSRGVRLLQSGRYVAVTGPYLYFDSPFFIRHLTMLMQRTLVKLLNGWAQQARRGGVMIGGNALMLAAVLEQAGGYNTKLRFYGDDTDLAIQMSRYGGICFSNRLVMKTSARRYRTTGFLRVQHRYNRAFFNCVFRGFIDERESVELVHPR